MSEKLIENTENTAEETQKTYTEADFNARLEEAINERINKILPSKIERVRSQERKKYESMLQERDGLLMASTGTTDFEGAKGKIAEALEKRGVKVPTRTEPTYSARELDILAKAEADETIAEGYEEVESEIARLNGADLGAREKAYYDKLVAAKKVFDDEKEMKKAGISKEDVQDADFIEFSKYLDPSMTTQQKYEAYRKYRPKPQKELPGTMVGTGNSKNAYKEFYTPEEARRLTREDLNDPKIEEAVTKSMALWK